MIFGTVFPVPCGTAAAGYIDWVKTAFGGE
jgi:hypothetical protein